LISYRDLPEIDDVSEEVLSIAYSIQSLYGKANVTYEVHFNVRGAIVPHISLYEKVGEPKIDARTLTEIPRVNNLIISELKPEIVDIAREMQSMFDDYRVGRYKVILLRGRERLRTRVLIDDFKTPKKDAMKERVIAKLCHRIFSRNVSHGCVYVIKSDGQYKIGVSSNLDNRLRTHRTSMPKGVLVAVRECGDSKALEKGIHHQLRNYRTTGEWFNLTNNALAEVIANFDFVMIGKPLGEYLYARTN